MTETKDISYPQTTTSDDSFNDRVDNLIEDMIRTDLENVETCKKCQKTIQDDIDNNNVIGKIKCNIMAALYNVLLVGDDLYHSECFQCDHCSER